MDEKRAWMVRAGHRGEREDIALREGLTIAGWPEVESLANCQTRDEIEQIVSATYPDESNYLIGNWTGQLNRFVNEMRVGDLIVMPLKTRTGQAIGRISGPYQYLADREPGYRHARSVEWLDQSVSDKKIRNDIRASLGALITICELARNDSAQRLEIVASGGIDPGAEGQFISLESLKDEAPLDVSMRALLELVGASRRSKFSLGKIATLLAENELAVTDDLTTGSIEKMVRIERESSADHVSESPSEAIPEPDDSTRDLLDEEASLDVHLPINTIPSATIPPEVVEPEDLISVAVSKMLAGNYSQLPVVRHGVPAGAITWRSIAIAGLAGGLSLVEEAMTPYPTGLFDDNRPISDILPTVIEHGYALVGGITPGTSDYTLNGIVTENDLNTSVLGVAGGPQIILREIELSLRDRVKAKVPLSLAKSATRNRLQSYTLITFGNYPFIIRDGSCWTELDWDFLDQEDLAVRVEKAARIRNRLMHYSRNPISDDEITELEDLLRIIRIVHRRIG